MSMTSGISSGTRFLVLVVVVAAFLSLMAVPALAGPNPPAAAQFGGLHTAHHATHGTPGHTKTPCVCPMVDDKCMECMGKTM